MSLGQQALVGGIQAELGHVFVVHDDQPLVAVLHESHIGLDQAGLNFVVAQSGPRIEGANVIERLLHSLDGTADGARDFLVLLVLQSAQMLIDDGDGIGEHCAVVLPSPLPFLCRLEHVAEW